MQLISKFNKGIRFLLCIIDILVKHNKGVTIFNAFHKILDDLKRKPNKIWVDKSNEFCNRSLKSWLENNGIEIYSTHNEGKSVVAESFIRTSKNKIYKHITAVSKMCIW